MNQGSFELPLPVYRELSWSVWTLDDWAVWLKFVTSEFPVTTKKRR